MPRIEPELQRLQEIKTLPSLLKYLKDDLNWPIGSDDTEDVTFDYDPAELGFDTASTAKIEEVRQLRPLTAGQKWGIFWVKFGKKQLPVQMLRRALGNLVVKKRASTKKVDKAAWQMHDLLFISAYGDDSNRHITFAHFSQEEDSESSLPVLKVLGWDDDDTLLHLKDTYKTLLSNLDWDKTDTTDPDAWRKQWSSAFTLGHREVINTTKELVEQLAKLATVIKKSVLTSIKAETEKGPWKKLMLAFKKTLIKDLDEDQFADVIAQTVSYGLLTARLSSDGQIGLKNLVDMVPSTNPFLKELLQHFLTSAGMKGLFDVDEAGINDVVELLNRANAQAIRNDFGKKKDGEDPVIHFYEHFLGAYNNELKVERGVFYTPQPVVSYIVRSVHELLQKEFGLEDGLADTSTWADVQRRHAGLIIPEGIKDPKLEPFVQILDPATGTATFLIEVIDVIHNTMFAKWNKDRVSKAEQIKRWNTYVPTYLLPRLYAYELMMAPYAIAHMKVGLKLAETGFTAWDKLGPENRANIYLTNALEPWEQQLELKGFNAIAQEAAEVNEVKKNKRFTVVIGNPPYSGHSSNNGDWAIKLIDPYYISDGKPLGERNTKWLQDDYVKFIALGQLLINKTSQGIHAYITNHGYIDNPTFRGMRQHICAQNSTVTIIDLHGNSTKQEKNPDGGPDKNVFDIKQGVAILATIARGAARNCPAKTGHASVFGTREHKYKFLNNHTILSTGIAEVNPASPFYLLLPQDVDLRKEYESFLSMTKVMPTNVLGFQTHRDHFAVDFEKAAIKERISAFRDNKLSDSEAEKKWQLTPNRDWNVKEARRQLRKDPNWEKSLIKCTYRPFDIRPCYFSTVAMDYPRRELIDHVANRENLCLGLGRQGMAVQDTVWHLIIASKLPIDANVFRRGGVNVFPLWLYPETDGLSFSKEPQPNFSASFIHSLASALKIKTSDQYGLPTSITAEEIFYYIYGILHSPNYRRRYSQFLNVDFPHLPITGNIRLFRLIAKIGKELTSLSLLDSEKVLRTTTTFTGSNGSIVEKISRTGNNVWIDSEQTTGFTNLTEEVWNFHIGGYQVCEKWLKDRKGRKLSKDDIAHFHKIIVALTETVILMNQVDKVIEEHGGWPGAFKS
jgi:predicted helicase